MTGRDRSVGWCEVLLAHGTVLFMPRELFDRIDSLLESQAMGWFTEDDVFGATRKFRLGDVVELGLQSPESLALEMIAQTEDDVTDDV